MAKPVVSGNAPVTSAAIVGEIRTLGFSTDAKAWKILEQPGCMECDGRSLGRAEYPELFSVLQDGWGSEDGGKTFLIPDLRGAFLRGWTHKANDKARRRGMLDEDADGREGIPANALGANGVPGNSGDAVGSFQRHAVMHHHHDYSDFYVLNNGSYGAAEGKPHGLNASRTLQTTICHPGAFFTRETRPSNVYVMYAIFAGRPPK